MMLMERREHLFSPDFGVKIPRGLLELIVARFTFGIGYVLLSIAIARDVLPRGAGYCSPLAARSTRSRPRSES
jgi:hypothetical protein